MAGQIYKIINQIIAQKARGNEIIASSIRTKMILKGININKYDAASADDPELIRKLQKIADELGVKL